MTSEQSSIIGRSSRQHFLPTFDGRSASILIDALRVSAMSFDKSSQLGSADVLDSQVHGDATLIENCFDRVQSFLEPSIYLKPRNSSISSPAPQLPSTRDHRRQTVRLAAFPQYQHLPPSRRLGQVQGC